MVQQKTITDSFENLSQAVSGVSKPVVDEASKLLETAKQQVVSMDSGTNEQGQQQSQANLQQLKQQKDAEAEARRKQIQRRLFDMIQKGSSDKSKEKTVQEKKEEEKKVKQFEKAKKEEKKLKPIAVSRGQRQAETQRGASG